MDMTKYAGSESKYLKAKDLQGKKVRLKIREVSLVTFEDDGKSKSKPAIWFEGKEKGMVLNGTNTETLCKSFGAESSEWIGKEVELKSHYYSGVDKEGLVVEAYQEVEFNDDIPF